MVIGSYPLVNLDASTGLQGRRFYRPGVVLGYCLLSLPLGLVLHGLNEARRGRRLVGYTVAGVSALVAVGMMASGFLFLPAFGFGLVGICMVICLHANESGFHSIARSKGGMDARWWPPLLWLLAGMVVAMLAVSMASMVTGGDDATWAGTSVVDLHSRPGRPAAEPSLPRTDSRRRVCRSPLNTDV